jgi:hypothetical protein
MAVVPLKVMLMATQQGASKVTIRDASFKHLSFWAAIAAKVQQQRGQT